jgi:hypothetical protein
MASEFEHPSGARSLRLVELVTQAVAVPLPVGLIPTMLQPALATDAGATAGRAQPASAQDAMTSIPASQVAHAPETSLSAEAAVAHPDMVTQSLEAARAAIHHSLLPASTEAPAIAHTSFADDDLARTIATGPLMGPLDAHDASVLPHKSVPVTLEADDATGAASTAHTGMAAIIPATAGVTGAAGELGVLRSAVDAVVHELAPIVQAPADAVIDTVLGHAVDAVAQGLGQNLEGLTSSPGHAASPPPDTVKVASLHGAGLDALAGLLPATAANEALHAVTAATTPASMDLGFEPIGLADVVHHEHDPGGLHALHAQLPSAGTGLI